MSKLKPLESACRRVSGIMLTAQIGCHGKARWLCEIREMCEALVAFKAGEVAGFKSGSMRSHGGV